MKAPRSIFIIILILCFFAQVNHFCFALDDNTMQTSAIVGAGIGLFDILTAPLSAKKHNEQLSTFGLKFSRNSLIGYPNPAANYSPMQSLGGRKSPVVALYISLVATGIPTGLGLIYLEKEKHETAAFAILSLGAVFGPSTGHFYAKKFRRGLVTAGLRFFMWAFFLKKVSEIESS